MKPKEKPHLVKEELVTYDDYAALDDGLRYEVVAGKLELMSPAPSPLHQSFSYELQYKLNQDCRSEYIIFSAPVDVILSETEVRQPDMVSVHKKRMSVLTKRGIEGAPDLVVEIMSTSSRKRDKIVKRKVYSEYSIPEYWIVDLSNNTLEQYMLKNNVLELVEVYAEDETISSEKITCVSFSMNDLLRNIPDLPK